MVTKNCGSDYYMKIRFSIVQKKNLETECYPFPAVIIKNMNIKYCTWELPIENNVYKTDFIN